MTCGKLEKLPESSPCAGASLIIVQDSPALHSDTQPALDCKCFEESKSGQEESLALWENELVDGTGISLGKSG